MPSKIIKDRVIRGSKLHRRNGKCRMEVELVGQVIKCNGKCRKAKGSVIKGRKLELLKGKCLNISQKCLNTQSIRTRCTERIKQQQQTHG